MFVVENKASHNHLAIVQGLDICVINSFSSAGFKKNLNNFSFPAQNKNKITVVPINLILR